VNIDNYIESQYQELISDINIEFIDLYSAFQTERLQEIFSTLHHLFVINYKSMNDRLPTGEYSVHFWAEPSRALIRAIQISTGLQRVLKNSTYAFTFDPYYQSVIEQSKYIEKHNTSMDIGERKNIVNQILREFQYIHSKNLLHRDISPKNILLKLYEDVIVVKISDFGLVKIPDSQLTTVNTDFKGYFNDPSLIVEGFDKYSMVHETYALTRLIYYIMTGKTNLSDINGSDMCAFVAKGLSADKKIL